MTTCPVREALLKRHSSLCLQRAPEAPSHPLCVGRCLQVWGLGFSAVLRCALRCLDVVANGYHSPLILVETVFPNYSGIRGSNNRLAVCLSLLLCDPGRALLTPLKIPTLDPPQSVEQLRGAVKRGAGGE